MCVVGPLPALRQAPGVALPRGAGLVLTVQPDVQPGMQNPVPLHRGEPLARQARLRAVEQTYRKAAL